MRKKDVWSCSGVPATMTKRKTRSSGSLGDVMGMIVAVVFFAVMYAVIVIVEFVFAYWYVFTILAIVAGYLWHKHQQAKKDAVVPYSRPVPQYITTYEKINTPTGFRTVRTKTVPEPPSPAKQDNIYTILAGLAGFVAGRIF
jgi:hypothetical protein